MTSGDPPRGGEQPHAPSGGAGVRHAHGLRAVIRWVAGHARNLYAAVGLFLVLGLGLSLLGLLAFWLIAREVAGGVTRPFDTAVLVWMHHHTSPAWDVLALLGAALGSGVAVSVVLVAGSLYFLRTRHFASLALLWLSLAGAQLLSATLKVEFARPRPRLFGPTIEVLGRSFDYPGSYSFPSGHAVAAVTVFATLAYLVARLEPTARVRRWTIAGAVALVLLIGLSRLYLGVHYPTDVLAGYFAGFIWATFSAFAIEVVRYVARREPEARQVERDLERGMEPVRRAFRHGQE